jgi:hypothetical protein
MSAATRSLAVSYHYLSPDPPRDDNGPAYDECP